MYKTGKPQQKAKAAQPATQQSPTPRAVTPQPTTSKQNLLAGLPNDVLALIKSKLPHKDQISLGMTDRAQSSKPDMIRRQVTREVNLVSRSAPAKRLAAFKTALTDLDAQAHKLDLGVSSNLYMNLAGKLALMYPAERAQCLDLLLRSASIHLAAEWQVIVLLGLKPVVDQFQDHEPTLYVESRKQWQEACNRLPTEQKRWMTLAQEAERIANEKDPANAEAQCLELLEKLSSFDVVNQALPLFIVLPRLQGLACRSNVAVRLLDLIKAQAGAAAANLAVALAQSLSAHGARESDQQTQKMYFEFLLDQAERLPAEFSAPILESLICVATLAGPKSVLPDALQKIVKLCLSRQSTDDALLEELLGRAEKTPGLLELDQIRALLKLYTSAELNHRDPAKLAGALRLVETLPAEHRVEFLPKFGVMGREILSGPLPPAWFGRLTKKAGSPAEFRAIISFVQAMLVHSSGEHKVAAHGYAAKILGNLASFLDKLSEDAPALAEELLALSTGISSKEVGSLLQQLLLHACSRSDRKSFKQVLIKCFGLSLDDQAKVLGNAIRWDLVSSDRPRLLQELMERRKLLGPEVVKGMLIEAAQDPTIGMGMHAPAAFEMILKAAAKLSDKADLRKVLKPLAEKVSGLPPTGRNKIMKTILALAASVSKECEQEMLRTIKDS